MKTPIKKRKSTATQAKQKTTSTIPGFKSVAPTDISLGGYRYKSKQFDKYKFSCRGELSVNNTPPKKNVRGGRPIAGGHPREEIQTACVSN